MVKALVRDPEKAARVLPEAVRLVQGDLEDPESVKRFLSPGDRVYLNVAAMRPPPAFCPERDGVPIVVKAAEEMGVERIVRLTALEMREDSRFWLTQNMLAADESLRAGQVPWVLLRSSWAMETLETFVRGGRLWVFGRGNVGFYWVSGDDLGRLAAAALVRDEALGKEWHCQGPEELSLREAARRYAAARSRPVPVSELKNVTVGLLGLFSARYRFLSRIMRDFAPSSYPFTGEETWNTLAKPSMSIEGCARYLEECGDRPRKTIPA